MSQSGNFAVMELTRRSLFLVGAAVAGGTVVVAPAAHAADAESDSSRESLTSYDRAGLQENPANQLGCPLGKGI